MTRPPTKLPSPVIITTTPIAHKRGGLSVSFEVKPTPAKPRLTLCDDPKPEVKP